MGRGNAASCQEVLKLPGKGIIANAAEKRESFEGEKRKQFDEGVLGLDLYKMREPLKEAGFKYFDTNEDLKEGI